LAIAIVHSLIALFLQTPSTAANQYTKAKIATKTKAHSATDGGTSAKALQEIVTLIVTNNATTQGFPA
jgi:divalent metal cation (Fe/Co/Zn/Cd) transporter